MLSVNRTSFSVSRGEDLRGWEISQLLLLHDDLGKKKIEYKLILSSDKDVLL